MRVSKIKRVDVALAITVILMLVSIFAYQKRSEHQTSPKAMDRMNYLPSGTFLRGLALGYDEAFADFLWVRTVGYFGAHVKTDRDFTWLIHMLKLTIELDPMYESPYEFAAVILPSELNEVDEGMAFLEKGVKNIPQHNKRYWLQPFYLGFCYMIYKDDPIKAARYFEIAARFPQSPPFLPLLVTRLYGRAGKPGVGIDIIQSVLNEKRADNKQRERVHLALKKRIKELIVAQDIKMLKNAISEYEAIFRIEPAQLGDLVDGLLLPFIPDEPLGGSYFLSIDCKNVLSTNSKGEFEIYKQKGGLQVTASPRSKQ